MALKIDKLIIIGVVDTVEIVRVEVSGRVNPVGWRADPGRSGMAVEKMGFSHPGS